MSYRLKRHGREFYDQLIETTPPVATWEASFDGGASWHAGTALSGDDAGWFRWLIAGDLADAGDSVAQLAPTEDDLVPQARSVGTNPEIVVRDLEGIRVT